MKQFVLAAFGAAFTFSGALADEFGIATYYHNPNHEREEQSAHMPL